MDDNIAHYLNMVIQVQCQCMIGTKTKPDTLIKKLGKCHGLKTKQKQATGITHQDYELVDINSFSEMQKLAYNIVKNHFNNTSVKKDPLCLIITGVAGTGKNYLINALRNLLQNRCAVAATTGKASYKTSDS